MTSMRFVLAQRLCRHLPPLVAQRLRAAIYPSSVAFRENRSFVAAAQTGSLLKNRTGDFHGYPFAIHGYYEWRNWAIAIALAGPGATLVEVGANIGTETVGFADIVGPSGRVFAFEPLPANYRMLQETLALNHADHVTAFPCAVSDRPGRTLFCPPTTSETSGTGHLVSGGVPGSGMADPIEVQCVTLDSLEGRLGKLSAVFVDAEGAEVLILRGARQALTRHGPAIVLEVSPKLLRRAGCEVSDLTNELDSLGYACFGIGRFGIHDVSGESGAATGNGNWLCLRSGDSLFTNLADVRRTLLCCGLLPCIAGINPMCRRRKRL